MLVQMRHSQTHLLGYLDRDACTLECGHRASRVMLRSKLFDSQFHHLEIVLPNYFIDLIFLFDLILNFRTTHLDEEGE